MALIICTECGKGFSDKASSCPSCACPTEVVLKELEMTGNSITEPVSTELNSTEPTLVHVLLRESGPNKVLTIKVIRELTGLGLVEAKAIIDKSPTYIYKSIDNEKAVKIQKKLMEIGATIEIVSIPMSENLGLSGDEYDKTPKVPYIEQQTQTHLTASYQDPRIICPKCGSNNYKVISGASKGVHWALWGPLGAGKILSKYQCRNCKQNF